MRLVETTRFVRQALPHWEIRGGRYFVTVRCAGSLPREIMVRLQSIHQELAAITPQSKAFAALQRRYFATMEKYLDGAKEGGLNKSSAASILAGEFAALSQWHVDVPHYSIMPNHWHALLAPREACRYGLAEIMKRIKGRSAHAIRGVIGGSGPFWQREWFDRWIRDDAEWNKCVAYIRNNPVKAGITERWSDHPWTR